MINTLVTAAFLSLVGAASALVTWFLVNIGNIVTKAQAEAVANAVLVIVLFLIVFCLMLQGIGIAIEITDYFLATPEQREQRRTEIEEERRKKFGRK